MILEYAGKQWTTAALARHLCISKGALETRWVRGARGEELRDRAKPARAEWYRVTKNKPKSGAARRGNWAQFGL